MSAPGSLPASRSARAAEVEMAARSRVISLSIDEDLLARFDGWVAAKAYGSRSHAFQALVREKLDAIALGDERGRAVATVTFIYDHHRRELMERIAHLQHAHLDEVVASTHVHLDHARCLEVLVLRGEARRIRALAERIIGTRGVERGEVTLAPVGGGGGGRAHENENRYGHGHGHGRGHGHGHGHGSASEEEHARSGPPWHAAAHAGRGARAPASPGARARGRGRGRRAR
jgi:CopG family nickel-responsive transcriptional regulator